MSPKYPLEHWEGDPNDPLWKALLQDNHDAKEQRRPPPEVHMAKHRSSRMLMYTKAGQSVSLENHWQGATGFLVLSGPSSRELDLTQLNRRGAIVMCLNNSWSLVRPTMWTAVDDPCTFLDTGWKDPGIMKLVPYGKVSARLGTRLESGKFRWSSRVVSEMPNVWFYKRNEKFRVSEYLTEDTVNWGNHQKFRDELGCKGSRSVMLAGVRLLYYFGFSTIYLIGADFHMSDTQKYAFAQDREQGSISGNNNTYKDLNLRFKAVRAQMEATGFKVFNCNPQSRLEAFDHRSYADAIKHLDKYNNFNTDGWYTWHKATGKKLKPGQNP